MQGEKEPKASMTKTQNLFFSCVESRIEDHGSMYGRFHIGTFFRGQALTFANALRRTLLSEIPGVTLKDVLIEGTTHEFATLPGIEESVLDILFNLKSVVFVPCTSKIIDLETFQTQAILRGRGPTKLIAGDIKLPPTLKCVNPKNPIATLTGEREFLIQFNLSISSPNFPHLGTNQQSKIPQKKLLGHQQKHTLNFESTSMPIQKVNYGIKSLNVKQGSEYIVFEVWTDGSILPQEAVDFGLKQLINLFYQFSSFGKNSSTSKFLPKL